MDAVGRERGFREEGAVGFVSPLHLFPTRRVLSHRPFTRFVVCGPRLTTVNAMMMCVKPYTKILNIADFPNSAKPPGLPHQTRPSEAVLRRIEHRSLDGIPVLFRWIDVRVLMGRGASTSIVC